MTKLPERKRGARWRKLRKMQLAREPLCRQCKEEGRVSAATHVSEIVAPGAGGTDAFENLESLCASCHGRKRRVKKLGDSVYQKSQIPVTVVAGPPLSGKTTYVKERAERGDLIVDVDALYSAISGLPWYDRPTVLLPFVMEARDAIIRRLGRDNDVGRAWVITGEANQDELDRVVEGLGADLVVLDVPESECIRRIGEDERRDDQREKWQELVKEWWVQWRA